MHWLDQEETWRIGEEQNLHWLDQEETWKNRRGTEIELVGSGRNMEE